jgi:regulator of protease activity HflC (stomatin/prohibitin superfamily)
MDALTRIVVIGVPCAVVALVMLFPALGVWLILGFIALVSVALKVGLHTTPDPLRPIITRFGQMHRLGPPGSIFVLPGVDGLAGLTVDMRPTSQDLVIAQVSSAEGESVYLNLELTWQIHPDLVLLTPASKQMLLKNEEQRRRMMEQTVSVVARQLMLSYTAEQLRRSDLREGATEILRDAVNEILAPQGLWVATVFWRGSLPAKEYLEAKLAIKIAHERLEATIKDVQLVRQHLPEVAPAEFLAQQAWIDLLRRGVPPSTLPGLPYMPPPPKPPE